MSGWMPPTCLLPRVANASRTNWTSSNTINAAAGRPACPTRKSDYNDWPPSASTSPRSNPACPIPKPHDACHCKTFSYDQPQPRSGAAQLETIQQFLQDRRATHNGPDLVDHWTQDMETQVNVSAEGGQPLEGKRGIWTDGATKWWNIRVPKKAKTEPEFKNYD